MSTFFLFRSLLVREMLQALSVYMSAFFVSLASCLSLSWYVCLSHCMLIVELF